MYVIVKHCASFVSRLSQDGLALHNIIPRTILAMSTVDLATSANPDSTPEALAAAVEDQELDANFATVNAVRQRKVAQAVSHKCFAHDLQAVSYMTGPLNMFIEQLSYRTTILSKLIDEPGLTCDETARLRKQLLNITNIT